MISAKLIGNIWATRKLDALNGHKLMLAEVIGGLDNGIRIVVIDTIGAGIGDKVIVAQGSAARRALEDDDLPVDAAVVGIIDSACPIDDYR